MSRRGKGVLLKECSINLLLVVESCSYSRLRFEEARHPDNQQARSVCIQKRGGHQLKLMHETGHYRVPTYL